MLASSRSCSSNPKPFKYDHAQHGRIHISPFSHNPPHALSHTRTFMTHAVWCSCPVESSSNQSPAFRQLPQQPTASDNCSNSQPQCHRHPPVPCNSVPQTASCLKSMAPTGQNPLVRAFAHGKWGPPGNECHHGLVCCPQTKLVHPLCVRAFAQGKWGLPHR